uniref:Secreted protein n=1 Tax=Trypanosoma vivax (strain Y486) TaxID=1055687 RepID=G0U1W1_TRYVY|nr:conserved hypothetical protein [Trypanosoma vivax Y486]
MRLWNTACFSFAISISLLIHHFLQFNHNVVALAHSWRQFPAFYTGTYTQTNKGKKSEAVPCYPSGYYMPNSKGVKGLREDFIDCCLLSFLCRHGFCTSS